MSCYTDGKSAEACAQRSQGCDLGQEPGTGI